MVASENRTGWYVAVSLAIAAGLYFRFAQFGTWPLAVDEYYLFRSVNFIFDNGVPQFACGGFYVRGLLYQYLLAPFLYAGLSPESSLRFISIISNLATLPAAWLLARRLGGTRAATIVLIVLALSTWEIEMARFGRMYAPFQMIFMWYTYHACQLVTTHDLSRWRWLFALSILGILVWEGAVILAVLNFVPLVLDRRCALPRHITGSAVTFFVIAAYLQVDFRFLEGQPAGPGAGTETVASAVFDTLMSLRVFAPLSTSSTAVIVAIAVCSLVLVLLLLRGITRGTLSALETLTLLLGSVALLANQLLLAALVFLAAGLADWIRLSTLKVREAQGVLLILGLVGAWYLFGAFRGDYADTLSGSLKVLIGFPDVFYTIVYPWILALPVMFSVLALSALCAGGVCLASAKADNPGPRLLLLFIVIAVGILGIAPTKYEETRYAFFMYPLLVCMAAFCVSRLAGILDARRPVLASAIPAVFVLVFLASPDFAIAHLSKIGTYDANFRVGYPDRRARHYYPRMDFRGPAEFVNERAAVDDTIVVTSVVFTAYVNRPNLVYLDRADGRFESQICADGTTERWTNLPLLSSIDQLAAVLNDGESAAGWLIVDEQVFESPRWARFLEDHTDVRKMYTSPDDRASVWLSGPAPAEADGS